MKKLLIAFCLLLCLLVVVSTASAATKTKVYASFHDEDQLHSDFLKDYALSTGYYNQDGDSCKENSNWVIYFDGNDNLTLRNAKLKSLSTEGSLNIQLEGNNSIKPSHFTQTYKQDGAAVVINGNLAFCGKGTISIDTEEMKQNLFHQELRPIGTSIAIQVSGKLTISESNINCIAGKVDNAKAFVSAGVVVFDQISMNSGSLRAASSSDHMTIPAIGLLTMSDGINANDAIYECSAEFDGSPLSTVFFNDYELDGTFHTFFPENSDTPCKDVKIYFSRPEDPSITTVPSAGASASDLPQTGDRANLAIWVMMLVLSAAMILKQRKTA